MVVAGFHTGRSTVAAFFDIATACGDENNDEDSSNSAELRIEEIYEIDVDGNRRKWERLRAGEGMVEAKRWCVVALLVQNKR